ncbi:MAG TPA: GNAT family N-acetyltransferase [Pyrinomonadaceae bacterium]|nr:GNAT family N-acetyltransferase [Pyrinomonadaceae bacterium]
MKSIKLIKITNALREALENGSTHFEARYDLELGSVVTLVHEVVEQTLTNVHGGSEEAPWGGYLGVDDETRAVIGTCAFRSPPAEDATVEIAYFTFPAYEGQGYATTMASKLIETASLAPEVRRIIAHTLPEPNASTRVLEKIGMRFAGEVIDPEDGRVWEWEIMNKGRA